MRRLAALVTSHISKSAKPGPAGIIYGILHYLCESMISIIYPNIPSRIISGLLISGLLITAAILAATSVGINSSADGAGQSNNNLIILILLKHLAHIYGEYV